MPRLFPCRQAQALAAGHFAATGCMSGVMILMPAGPFAPAANFVLIAVFTALLHLRFKVSNEAYFGLPGPDHYAVFYAMLLAPAMLGFAMLHWRSERSRFLVSQLSRQRAELRLEQLNVEKERLDYERRFALHQHEQLLQNSGEIQLLDLTPPGNLASTDSSCSELNQIQASRDAALGGHAAARAVTEVAVSGKAVESGSCATQPRSSATARVRFADDGPPQHGMAQVSPARIAHSDAEPGGRFTVRLRKLFRL